MNQQKSYPASQIEPGWQILIDEQWLLVSIVVETETHKGTRYITFVFDDPKIPAVKLGKTEIILARPPYQSPTVESGS